MFYLYDLGFVSIFRMIYNVHVSLAEMRGVFGLTLDLSSVDLNVQGFFGSCVP